MEWQVISAVALVFLIVLFSAAFVWYINIGGICAIVRERRAKKVLTKS